MQDTSYSVGPKFFGNTAKKSWFDQGDRCAPGPGAHDLRRTNMQNPPSWGTSKGTERDSFLQKYHRQYPQPDRYKVVDPDKNHPAEAKYSIPKYEVHENPNKIDEGSVGDYKPRPNVPKEKYPHYSFGYYFQRDYSTKVPPPDSYRNQKPNPKKTFNRTQRSFSVGQRPTPYGEEGKYPYVGKYNVGGDMGGSKYSIGKTSRPNYVVGAGADGDYNLAGTMLKTGQGKTMGLLIEVPRNKDKEEFPPPDHYNPVLPRTDRNIINYRSQRPEIKNEAVEKYPSPQRYRPELNAKEQTISFTQQLRIEPQPPEYPGVGTYQVQKELNKTLGNMGLKLKKLTQFVNPAPDNYTPSHSLTKPQSQRPINYDANRTDFSKSITGKRVGPGVYQVQNEERLSLGKIGKGPKFGPNKNKNPGPGSYEIPSGIGKLPKYCSGPKKMTETGLSVLELERQDRMKRIRAKQEARARKEEEQERLRRQQQVNQ